MPEGDSIFKVAQRLRPAFVGKPLSRVDLRDRGPIPMFNGRLVRSIEAHGKHMFVRIEPDWVLHIHLGMHGRWRSFPGGVARHFPRAQAMAILGVDSDVHVCFRAAFARVSKANDPRLLGMIDGLGPDLLSPSFDPEHAARRAQSVRGRTVAEVLAMQRVAAGVGNVYKSEILFLCGVHPLTAAEDLSAQTWVELFRCGSTLMNANLGEGRRTTTNGGNTTPLRPGAPRVWVYRRRGDPCLRCGTKIERALVGDLARSTYWCPKCQPERASQPGSSTKG